MQDLKMNVDYEYNVGVARNAKAQGCEQFHLISGAGVTSKSRMEFLRNKVDIHKMCACDIRLILKYAVYYVFPVSFFMSSS